MVCPDVRTEPLLREIRREMLTRGINRAKLKPSFSKISRIEAQVEVGDVEGLSTNFQDQILRLLRLENKGLFM